MIWKFYAISWTNNAIRIVLWWVNLRKLKLNYEQIEGLVDLFFIETKLKTIFPNYKIQNVGVANKELFYNIIKIKNSPK